MIESGYFMNAIIRNLEMVRADTMSFGFQVKGLQGQRPNFVQFSCKNSLEDSEYLFAVSLNDTIDVRSYDAEKDILTYSVRIPPEKTAGLAEGRYFYDLEMRVNGDTITLMIGRLEIIEQVTDSAFDPSPEYEDGDLVLYPRENIPVGLQKLYTESIISEIGDDIEDITGHSGGYTTADMVTALDDIKEDVSDINASIKAKTGATEDIPLSEMATAIDSISTGSGDLLALMQDNGISSRFNLTDEVVRSSATKIRAYGFYQCFLGDINLQSIEEIKGYAFYASSARSLVIPNCKTIREYAFKDLSRSDDPITNFDLSGVETFEQYCFERAKLKNTLVLSSAITIANNAFVETQAGGYGLIAPLVETIGQNAFRSTYFSGDIDLPKVKTIGNFAFGNTSSVNFRIGADCTSIGGRIFYSAGVTNLYCLATTPPTLGGNFNDASGYQGVQHIYVPAESVDLYKSANNWSNYASIIEAIPST